MTKTSNPKKSRTNTKSGPLRHLEFKQLSDAITESESLLRSGYTAGGNWSLAMILGHCDYWLSSTFEKPPHVPTPMKPVFWGVRTLIGPMLLNRIRTNKKMGGGLATAPQSIVDPASTDSPDDAVTDGDPRDTAAIDSLRATIERFESHGGPIHTSPIFGSMDKSAARELHLVHLAHHLGYLKPAHS